MPVPDQPTNILVIGATGYVGGTIFLRLLEMAGVKDKSINLTVLVRTQVAADKFTKAFPGVNPVVGSLSDDEILFKLAQEADVVLSMAVVNDEPGLTVMLRGLKLRGEATGRTPIVIHVSGASLVIDYAKGNHVSETIYSDKNREQLDEVLARPTQFHAGVFYLLEKADQEGYVRTYIVVPSYVSGILDNKLTEVGLQNTLCTVILIMARTALGRGQAAIIGQGLNKFSWVDNEEHADMFMLLLNAAIYKPDSCGHGREGVYYAGSGEIPWRDFNEAVGEGLFKAGKVPTPEVSTMTQEEEDKFLPFPMAGVFGSNVRISSDRAYDLGWKPKRTIEQVKECITKEVLQFVKQTEGSTFKGQAALLIQSKDEDLHLAAPGGEKW